MTETIPDQTPTADTASAYTRPGAAESLAAGSTQWQQLVELCRAARDVETLAREFLVSHPRLCGCPLCLHFAVKGGPTAKAARQLLRTVDSVVRVSVALRSGARACGPDAGRLLELARPAEVTKRGIERSRRRLALSRSCGDPKAEPKREKVAAPPVPCG